MSDRVDRQDAADVPTSAPFTRRNLVAAGVAGGLGGGLASTDPADAADSLDASTGPRGSSVVEFRGRIAQTGDSGQTFTSQGYLTKVSHLSRSHLFDARPHSESTALLTVVASGDLRARVL